MKPLLIAWRLLRYRVAVMLLLFMFLGVALHDGFVNPAWSSMLLAACALAASYISATSVNDLADARIDAINHKNSPGRPLVNGDASPRDIWVTFAVASATALALGLAIRPAAALVMAIAIFINVAYSLPPIRFSYRTFLAPLALGLGYVCVPYLLGVTVVGDRVQTSDVWWMTGLYLLFVGRILLKDFRDRKGDAAFGKPTFLLRFGKPATCVTSGVCISIGGTVLALRSGELWIGALVVAFVISILAMLVRLYGAREGKAEQVSIGVGAKMGNGLLITLLSVAILTHSTTSSDIPIPAVFAIATLFFANFVMFLRRPEQATIGYKG